MAAQLGLDVSKQLACGLGPVRTDAPLVRLEQLAQIGIIHELVLLWIWIDDRNVRGRVTAAVQDALESLNQQLVCVRVFICYSCPSDTSVAVLPLEVDFPSK